jgi:hypothetical protein
LQAQLLLVNVADACVTKKAGGGSAGLARTLTLEVCGFVLEVK